MLLGGSERVPHLNVRRTPVEVGEGAADLAVCAAVHAALVAPALIPTWPAITHRPYDEVIVAPHRPAPLWPR